MIEGLSRSGEDYTVAIDCLKARYNRPRLIHQTHVKCIVDFPSLKDGNGKELCKLHDTIQQHLCALSCMGQEPSAFFIISINELKLDTNTMFEWQRHSQSHIDVPHYNELLEFIDHRAQASESITPVTLRKGGKDEQKLPKHCPSFPCPTITTCVSCKTEKHPLCICRMFKELPHDQKIAFLKTNKLCLNFLTS